MDHDDDWILFRLQRLDPGRFEEFCCALLTAEGMTYATSAPREPMAGSISRPKHGTVNGG